MYIIYFESGMEMQIIMNKRPWLFDNHLLSLKSFDDCTSPLKMDFFIEVFWVQLHHLPLGCMYAEIGSQVWNTIETAKECNVQEDGTG